MPVYVDDMHLYPAGQFGRMKMSHLLADTDEELHAMADKIGVARRWHQAPPRHDSHYDIAMSKRAQALAHGAVSITWRQAGAMNMRRCVTGQLGDPASAEAWLQEHMAAKRAAKEGAA
jgi:hypothetical protein